LAEPIAAKRPNIAHLRLLLPFLAPYRWRVLGASLALMVAAGTVLLLGPGVRQLVDKGFAGGSMAQLDRTALALFGLVALLAVATMSARAIFWFPGLASGSRRICAVPFTSGC
jgi:ATP-binding cassette subfamily B protein